MPPIRNWISIAFTTRNAMVHDEKRIWTSVDGSHYVGEHGRGVIKTQIASRSSCTAGRSATEGDETIAVAHAKI
jgi:hypothetical protein